MGGGRSPSPFFGGVLKFLEPGDIRTGLKGVLLVVLLELGLEIPNPGIVGGGVVILPADIENFSSKSARNVSSCFSVEIEEDRLLDQGVEL